MFTYIVRADDVTAYDCKGTPHCFLNVVVQTLWNVTPFRDHIIATDPARFPAEGNSTSSAFQARTVYPSACWWPSPGKERGGLLTQVRSNFR